MSITTEEEMQLGEFLDFFMESPDIVLEKELQWPAEPDLIY